MEQLTSKEPRVSGMPGVCCTHFGGGDCEAVQGRCSDGCPWEEAAWDRLAAYEDTGLEPGDIDALLKREQGLAELLVNVSCGCAVPYTRLAELAQAEKDGRLVVFPPNDPLTLEELREIEGKSVPVWCDKANGYIFIAVTKTEPYNQVWYFNHKGFACTVLYYSTKFYRRKPEVVADAMPTEFERPLPSGFVEHIHRRFGKLE